MIPKTITPSCPPQGGNVQARLAVIGDPISHSLSPLLQNSLIAHFGLPFVYEALHVRAEDLPVLVARLRRGELAGVNVTIPHKQAIIPMLDELVYPADRIGAVNTVCIVKGRLVGHNTDAVGFQRSCAKANIALSNKEILLLGAGGAAKALVFALLEKGARTIHLCNRNRERAERLRESLSHAERERVRIVSWEERAILAQTQTVEIVINTTSVGMHETKTESPLPVTAFHKGMAAIDLIYNPAETLFLQQAERAGAIVSNGLPMLIYQGLAALELWSGRRLKIETIYAALEKRMREAL